MNTMKFFFLSALALSINGIGGQQAFFQPNNQNIQNQNFPPRLNAGGSQAFLPPTSQLSGSQTRLGQQQRGQPVSPNTSQLTDRQRLAFLQGNSINNQGFRGLRPAFQQSGPFPTPQAQLNVNNQIQQFSGQQVGQPSQFGLTLPAQTQLIPRQNTVQNFPQQQFSQQRPVQSNQFAQTNPTQQFAQRTPAQQFAQRTPNQQFAQRTPTQQFAQTNPAQQFAQTPNFSLQGNIKASDLTQQTQAQQFQSKPQISQPALSHPEQFLNQLNSEEKQKFLSQFEQLTQEQQSYAYNKFLSTPADVQLFAINQFLSLDPQVLAVSLQEEIRKEQSIAQGGQQFLQTPRQGPQQPIALAAQQQSLQAIQQRFASRPQGVQQIVAPIPQGVRQSQQRPQASQPSVADQLALRKQQEALQQIIDLQNSINFPNGS